MKVKCFFKPTKAERIHPYPTDPTRNVKMYKEMLYICILHMQQNVSLKKERNLAICDKDEPCRHYAK